VNSVTSFSDKPLVWIFYLGCLISLFSLLAIFTLAVRWAFFDRPLAGWTSVIASIWLVGGMVISFVGIIGLYLSKIFSETKHRPYTIIRQIHKNEKE
jgi:putative glycosyltransferase